MIRRVLHIFFSVWLAVLLLLGQTPKEFMHLFARHIDTVHVTKQGVSFESQHHHCGYLSFSLLPFDGGFKMPVCYTMPHMRVYTSYQQPGDKDVVLRRARASSLRGPPVA